MTTYYNENDPFAAAWLRQLIADGNIAHGEVDDRSIRDVRAEDLRGFTQCHFFGGIGGWSYALRLAGWPDDRPVWTASCPCQPFSPAGRRLGVDDERHLWPVLFGLIRECRPDALFGEQVAGPDGVAWFDVVAADMEREAYAIGAASLCAASIGAPHERQRLYFVAVASSGRLARSEAERWPREHAGRRGGRATERVGDASGEGLEGRASVGLDDGEERATVERAGGAARGVGDASSIGRAGLRLEKHHEEQGARGLQPDGPSARGLRQGASEPGPVNGFWRDAEWLPCRDGKRRPVEPGTFPLAHGIPGRVGLIRGYGNAIVPELAATFIEAFMTQEIP